VALHFIFNHNMKKTLVLVVSLVGGLILFGAIFVQLIFFGCGMRYEEFSLPAGRRVEILRPTVAEPTYGFCYRVFDGSRVVVPKFFIEAHSEVPQSPYYRLVTNPGSNFLGIVGRGDSGVVIAMHDFNTGESWPYPGGMNYDRGRVMLERLRLAVGDANLFLTGTAEAANSRKLR
jgi:hypothetical protein